VEYDDLRFLHGGVIIGFDTMDGNKIHLPRGSRRVVVAIYIRRVDGVCCKFFPDREGLVEDSIIECANPIFDDEYDDDGR